MISKE
jgi:phospholipid-translocating ATPase